MSAPIEFTRLASFDTSPCAGRIERHGYSRQCRQTPLWHTEVGAVCFSCLIAANRTAALSNLQGAGR